MMVRIHTFIKKKEGETPSNFLKMIAGALWEVNSEMLDGRLAKEMNTDRKSMRQHTDSLTRN